MSKLKTTILAFSLSDTGMGDDVQSQTKLPTLMLFMSTLATLRMTESPAKHICSTCSSFTLMLLTMPMLFEGTMQTLSPHLTEPASILPASDIPVDCKLLKTSDMQNRSGLSMAFSIGLSRLMQSSRVRGSVVYQLVSLSHVDFLVKFSPLSPEQGTNMTSFSLKPTCLVRKLPSFLHISLNLTWDHSHKSILLTAMISWETPSDLTSKECSRVWPPKSKPVSNSPVMPLMTNMAQSACPAPVIMFGIKSLCPGASNRFTIFLSVSNLVCAMSIVTPRDLDTSQVFI